MEKLWKQQSEWDRKSLKKNGKAAFHRNYTSAAVVCFIFVLMGFGFGDSPLSVTKDDKDTGSGSIFYDLVSVDSIIENVENSRGGVLAQAWDVVAGYGSPVVNSVKHTITGFIGTNLGATLFAFSSLALVIGITVFVRNTMIVGERRFFLENMEFPKTPARRIFFVFREKKIRRVAVSMLYRDILLTLWALTIVGVCIKYYTYRLVPFLLAENPDMSGREAIGLSRQLMDGNKGRWLLMDITFLPWKALSAMTFRVFGFLYVDGYIRQTEVYLYRHIRVKALENQLPSAQLMNDDTLYLPNDGTMLGYPGVEVATDSERRNRGVNRSYSILHLILMFFAFCVFGWLWEVALHLIRDGVFVNRGFLHGPWLPIYGSGGVMILVLLKKFRNSAFLTVFMIIVLCGILEYATSWYMEMANGQRWWDYSTYLLNINGRICLEGLLIFAMGGCAIVYLLAPKLDDLLLKLPSKIKILLVVLLLMIFVADVAYSHDNPNQGHGITSGGRMDDYGAVPIKASLVQYRENASSWIEDYWGAVRHANLPEYVEMIPMPYLE